MTEERPSVEAAPLHPIVTELAEALARDAGTKVEIVRGDAANWLAIEETASTITFVEAEGNELHVVPFVGDAGSIASRTFVQSIGPSWLDGEQELVVDASALASYSDRGQVMDLMHGALGYWTRSTENPKHEPVPEPVHVEPAGVSESPDVDFSEPAVEEPLDEDTVVAAEANLRADISDQWSWASSAARIPQISDLTVEVADPIENARISVLVRDADVQFGTKIAFEGALQAGTSVLGSVHVPLSSRVMSQVEERHPAECVITLEDGTTGRVLARYDEELDIQPRDLWFWAGDPRRSEQRVRIRQRGEELAALLQENPERPDAAALEAELETLARFLQRDEGSSAVLSRSLLASFVRPNHPEIATIAREAADLLGRATGDSSFFAFQIDDVARAEERADATVTAIYEALQARSIS